MKKIFLAIVLVTLFSFSFNRAKAQLIDEKNVTFTMDLQPILQLNMETPDQMSFVFDEIDKYYGGITKYGATTLKISSTVNWDLYAIGLSNGTVGTGKFWDQVLKYGTNATGAIDSIPLSALEIHQSHVNPCVTASVVGAADYSGKFTAATATTDSANSNSVYYDPSVIETPPLIGEKYIAGMKTTGATKSVDGGSYMTQSGSSSDYYYTLDYRIIPGLPVRFPKAFPPTGTTSDEIATGKYAQPGVYTMYVKYVLLEDQ
ncbi:MAG: hypothetical protein WC223_06975 [Bacteroidales bacterium]|jgi:hypothetical protein